MSVAIKRIILGIVVLAEAGAVLVLGILLLQALQKKNNSMRYAARLPRHLYSTRITSDRFPHYFEPEINAIINDQPDWLDYEASYSINADSFNERDDYSVTKAPGTFRIITLGDSFTYGLLVNTYENYSERLEDKLNDGRCPETHYDVINLGVPAYDVGFAAERFKLRGQKYNPDLVIWFMNFFTFLIDADRKMELETEYLAKIQDSDLWQKINGRETYYPGQLAWIQHVGEVPEEMRIMKQVAYFREFLDSYQGPLLIVVNDVSLWRPLAKNSLEQALLYRDNAGIYPMDPLKSEGELLADGHPSVAGHKKIAENIYTYLYSHQLDAGKGVCR
ncbi:SGNH/GDSL hydrolase family protein [Candidatus Gottesmanbacteria bacterium]|nr:SGNH/GDSL hydrolase family protein [Candidatus Gottesmanbacteria bacterium]